MITDLKLANSKARTKRVHHGLATKVEETVGAPTIAVCHACYTPRTICHDSHSLVLEVPFHNDAQVDGRPNVYRLQADSPRRGPSGKLHSICFLRATASLAFDAVALAMSQLQQESPSEAKAMERLGGGVASRRASHLTVLLCQLPNPPSACPPFRIAVIIRICPCVGPRGPVLPGV